jgi:hypothetical protein
MIKKKRWIITMWSTQLIGTIIFAQAVPKEQFKTDMRYRGTQMGNFNIGLE